MQNTSSVLKTNLKAGQENINGLCIRLFAELNAFMGGVKHRSFFGGYKSFSTKGRAFKLIQDKDTPFGYDHTKFQTSALNH